MNAKEQTRLQVLNSLLAEHMTLDQAATLMGVSPRHTRRILADYRENGAASLAHGLRGCKPANATPEPVATAVVHLAAHQVRRDQPHLSQRVAERARGHRHRQGHPAAHLVDAGLSSPRQRRPPKHRVRRQRMPQQGMLIQMGGSHHPWLGNQVPPFALLIAVDDATGTVVGALFCEKEDARSYFLLIRGLLQRCGIPVALYTDRHGVFRHTPGFGLPGMPTQFSRAMEEMGIQMIFALSPQAKGRVERMAETFQDRLVTELRLSGADSIGEANSVLKQFLPRFNLRFRVPPQYPEPAFRPLDPELCLEQILCFKHRRKVAKDNTVRFQLHTLQLLPGRERPSYAGAAVKVLEGLDGRLSVRHEGRILAAQEEPPSPVFLRNGQGASASVTVPPSGVDGLGERWAAALEPLDLRAEGENGRGMITDDVATAGRPTATPARKPTFLQKERWKAIQKARRKGMSLRAIERELGIHRATIKNYMDAEGPPRRQTRAVVAATPSSDTIQA